MTKDKKNFTKNINLILIKSIGSIPINKQYTVEKLRKFFKTELSN